MNPLMNLIGGTNLFMQALNAYKNGTLDQFANEEMQRNPQFRKFVEMNQGKTQDQIAKEVGFDAEKFKSML